MWYFILGHDCIYCYIYYLKYLYYSPHLYIILPSLIFFSLLIVDGLWSQWSIFGACTKNCDGGQQIRSRLCNSPMPESGGLHCLIADGSGKRALTDIQSQACNSQTCSGWLPSL